MRSSHFAASLALVLVVHSTPVTLAQQTRPARPATGQPAAQNPGRPPAQPARNQVTQTSAQASEAVAAAPEEFPVTKELEDLLREWEQKSSQIKSVHGTHVRTVYNLVFEEERRASGTFFLRTPDMGRIDLVGTKPKSGEKSSRLGANGVPFRLQADNSERWICTGKEIVAINDEEKSYEVVPLPPETQGTNIVHSPLPFLFGMKAEEAKQRYRIKLHSNAKDRAILVIFPRLPSDRQNYVEAWIILEKANYLPAAVKLYDPTGKLETVYKFQANINDRSVWTKLGEVFGTRDKDPIHPDLRGYKYVLPPAAADAEPPRKNAQGDPRPGATVPRPIR